MHIKHYNMNIYQSIMAMTLIAFANTSEDRDDKKYDKFNISLGLKVETKDGIPFLYVLENEEPKRRTPRNNQHYSSEDDTKILKSKPDDVESTYDEGFWEPNDDLLKYNKKKKVSQASDISVEILKSEIDSKVEEPAKDTNLRKNVPKSTKDKGVDWVYDSSDSTDDTDSYSQNNNVSRFDSILKRNPKSLKSIFTDAIKQLRLSHKTENLTNKYDTKNNITKMRINFTTKTTTFDKVTKDMMVKPNKSNFTNQISDELSSETEEIILDSRQTNSKKAKTDKNIKNVSLLKSESNSDDNSLPKDLRKHFNRDTRENKIDNYDDENIRKFRAESETSDDGNSFQNHRKIYSSKEKSYESKDEVSYIKL